MGLGQWLTSIFGGDLGKLEQQRAAQEVDMLELPAEREFAGELVRLRLVEQADRDRILQFARSLPEHDLLFLRRDITSPESVDAWLRDVEEGAYSTVVALVGDELVGYATVASDGMTWTRHVGELRLLLAPRLRGHGLGSLLIEQAFAMARERGLKKIVAQMTTDQESAIRGFERLGFEREAILKRHVMDRKGELHDLMVMALDEEQFQEELLRARIRAAAHFQAPGGV